MKNLKDDMKANQLLREIGITAKYSHVRNKYILDIEKMIELQYLVTCWIDSNVNYSSKQIREDLVKIITYSLLDEIILYLNVAEYKQ